MISIHRLVRAVVLAAYLPLVDSVREAACGGTTPCAALDEADAAERALRERWISRLRFFGISTQDLEVKTQ